MVSRCECGALWLDCPPESYRVAVALVAAYVHGDAASFQQLYEEAREDVILALVEGTHVLLMLLAEVEGRSLSTTLESYCASAIRAAEDSL
jgi:hypothetical protein